MRVLFAYFQQFVNRSGGMEHVCCELANAMTARGYHADIVYASPVEGRPFYPVSEDVHLYNLFHLHREEPFDSGKYISRTEKIWRECIRIFRKDKIPEWNAARKNLKYYWLFEPVYTAVKPDVIISFEPQSTAVVLRGKNAMPPVITMMHFNPEILLNRETTAGEREGIVKSRFVQVLMPSYQKKVQAMFPAAHVVCIPNAVPQYTKHVDLTREKDVYTIVNVARIDKKQKQQHLLVQAFARLASEFPNWRLELWGEEQKSHAYTEELQHFIQFHHLERQVSLCGVTDDVAAVYRRADIFGFPSAYEGFPLAMTEAMSAGLPVIGLKTCPAVNEIVEDGKTGFLADADPQDLAEKLKFLMQHHRERVQMGHEAYMAMERYTPDLVWNQWDHLLHGSIGKI